MKTKIALTVVAGILCTMHTSLGASPASRPAAASAPAALVDPNAPVVRVDGNATVATHDLGKVKAGAVYFVVFEVQNAKDANVAIQQIRPDCECITALQPAPTFLAAQAVTRITARFVPPKVNDVYGSELIVRTDDPQRKAIHLRIQCKVESK
jgi:hypothetical protein